MMSEVSKLKSSHVLLMGDFNMPKINWSMWESTTQNPESLENSFLEKIRDAFLYQHVSSPTRGRNANHPSLIDLILTNEEGMVSDLEILSPLGKSDHACISFTFNCYFKCTNKSFSRYLYDKGNYENMKKDLTLDWTSELEKRITVNEKWKFISNKLLLATKKYIPIIRGNTKNKAKFSSPLDRETLTAVKSKHKIWKRYMTTREPIHYREYCKTRNKVRKLTKVAKRNWGKKCSRSDEKKS